MRPLDQACDRQQAHGECQLPDGCEFARVESEEREDRENKRGDREEPFQQSGRPPERNGCALPSGVRHITSSASTARSSHPNATCRRGPC